MALIGNVIWFILGGIWLGLSYVLAGVLCCCTIIGIPFGLACFRIAGFAFFPFGKKLVPAPDAGTGSMILYVIWVVFAGFWIALEAVVRGILLCCTIIGIPFGIACFNIAAASFAPLGKVVVPK